MYRAGTITTTDTWAEVNDSATRNYVNLVATTEAPFQLRLDGGDPIWAAGFDRAVQPVTTVEVRTVPGGSPVEVAFYLD